MTEKLLLKQDQLEAIRWLQSEGYSFDDIINGQSYKWSGANVACLNDLSVAEMAKILYTDEYEIEKTLLNEGDKVFYPKVGDIGTVVGDVVYWNDGSETDVDYTISLMEDGEMSFATKEEIFWLEEMNRNSIPDFRKHDIYVDGNMDAWLLGKDIIVDKAHKIYQEDDFLGLYPVDSFRSFHK